MKVSEEEWGKLPEENRLRVEHEDWKPWKLSRTIQVDGNDINLQPGEEKLSIEVKNNSQRSYYIYGINATPDACIVSFLFPGKKMTTEVRPGETSDFSDRYCLNFDNPSEYVRVIAATEPIVHVWEQSALDVEIMEDEDISRGKPSGVPHLPNAILEELISHGNFFLNVQPRPTP
jgi:hypothetical protein